MTGMSLKSCRHFLRGISPSPLRNSKMKLPCGDSETFVCLGPKILRPMQPRTALAHWTR